MAEFVEVAKHRKRMCESKTSCAECALNIVNSGNGCNDLLLNSPAEYERIVMKWAEEHPEPQYPTWEQWESKLFPENEAYNLRCHFERCALYGTKQCEPLDCRAERIPADIAEKLGIKPGKEWG